MINNEYLYNLINKGLGDNKQQTKEFIDSFDKSVCGFISEFNQSLLQESISNSKFYIARFLIEQVCNLNHQDNRGATALTYLLVSYDNDNKKLFSELIYLIIEKGADIHLIDSYGNQPLLDALLNAKIPLEMLDYLLQKGADMHHKNMIDISPYDMVKKFNVDEVTSLFEKYNNI